ncbi:MAG: 4-hydroxy-3-methylbut-2-enyl diphosphate reductase [Fibrobacterota bacterium]
MPPEKKEGTVVIRSHGVPPDKLSEISCRFSSLVNATCPKVARVQSMIRKHSRKGLPVIITGDRGHAEVKGLVGHSGGKALVVENIDEARALEPAPEVLVVSQTTFDKDEFIKITSIINSNFIAPDIRNTICESTSNRQQEVRSLCFITDAIIVVGGRSSANTARLLKISEELGTPALHIESPSELNAIDFSKFKTVAVTAGASTPRWLINETVDTIEEMDNRSVRGLLRAAAKFLVHSNIILASAAASLSYVFTAYMERLFNYRLAAVAFFYVFGMHNLNNYFLVHDFGRSSTIMRFRARHKYWLFPASLISLVLAVYFGAAESHGSPAGLVVLGFSIILGILYNVDLFSGWLERKSGLKSLHDIPGSKDILIPLAWSTVIVLFPVFSVIPREFHVLYILISFIITMALMFLRSTLLHLGSIEDDKIIGNDTIATYLGAKAALKIVNITVPIFIFFLVLLSYTGTGWRGAFIFSVNAFVVIIYVNLFKKKLIYGNFISSIVLDLNLVSAGFIAYAIRKLTEL